MQAHMMEIYIKSHCKEEVMAELKATTQLPTKWGSLSLSIFKTTNYDELMVASNMIATDTTNLRMHSACATSELFGSLKCDCSQQLDSALEFIAISGGVVVYLPQEGRGIGLTNKIRAYKLQESGFDTVQANHELGLEQDDRVYDDVAEVLDFLEIRKVNLITNNPLKLSALEQLGVKVMQRVPSLGKTNIYNQNYLKTKATKMGHFDL